MSQVKCNGCECFINEGEDVVYTRDHRGLNAFHNDCLINVGGKIDEFEQACLKRAAALKGEWQGFNVWGTDAGDMAAVLLAFDAFCHLEVEQAERALMDRFGTLIA